MAMRVNHHSRAPCRGALLTVQCDTMPAMKTICIFIGILCLYTNLVAMEKPDGMDNIIDQIEHSGVVY
jgi:hypothetical protein